MKYNKDYVIINNQLIKITKSGIYNLNYSKNVDLKIEIASNLEVEINEYYENDVEINTDIIVNQNTTVKYHTYNFNTAKRNLKITLFENAKLKNYSVELGNNNEVNYEFNLNGVKANVESSVAVYNDLENNNYNINTNHLAKYTKALIYNFGVVDNSANIIFDVKNYIEKGQIKSDTYQKSKLLMLSDKATGNINPILLIDEHDVMGGHAATVSRVNKDQVYYLNSRGLNDKQAKEILAIGYLLEKAPIDKYEELETILKRRINHESLS